MESRSQMFSGRLFIVGLLRESDPAYEVCEARV